MRRILQGLSAIALCAATVLPLPPHHHQTAANLALSHCHHRRCHCRRAFLVICVFL